MSTAIGGEGLERRDGPRMPVTAVATEAVTMVDVCTIVSGWRGLMSDTRTMDEGSDRGSKLLKLGVG